MVEYQTQNGSRSSVVEAETKKEAKESALKALGSITITKIYRTTETKIKEVLK